MINGSASALADLRIGHIEWVTGTSPMPVFGQISWTVKLLKENGQLVEGMSPRFNMSAVSVTPPCSWEISPNTGPGPELDGSVTATNGSKGKLRVLLKQRVVPADTKSNADDRALGLLTQISRGRYVQNSKRLTCGNPKGIKR